ncbi:hypothetical protein [Kitasatospora sp. NPDC088346]|uniref:hypothetical protein n=1 Tax=Kitasatospora sp. NPDC088346 TaxID=3364073 RepID=UPI0037F56F23
MTSRSNIRFTLLAFGGGIVPVACGWLLGWPVWLWVCLSALVLTGVALRAMTLPDGGGGSWAPDADPVGSMPPMVPTVPADLPLQEVRVVNVALPSALEDYDFLFSATVWWRPVHNHSGAFHTSPASLAIASVLERAGAMARQESPVRCELAGHRLGGALGIQLQDASALITASAADVTLGLAQADRERLERIEGLRKSEDAWEQQRAYERNQRTYLHDDVLRSPGSAVVWWLARHDEEVEKAVEMIGPLVRLSSVANDREVPEPFRHLIGDPVGDPVEEPSTAEPMQWTLTGAGPEAAPAPVFRAATDDPVIGPVAELLDDLGLAEGSDERAVFLHRIVRSAEAAGQPAAAGHIRQALIAPRSDDRSGASPGEPAATPVGPVHRTHGVTGVVIPGYGQEEPPDDAADAGHFEAVAALWETARPTPGGAEPVTPGPAPEADRSGHR